jgi:DNA-binding NtrC family response regulator
MNAITNLTPSLTPSLTGVSPAAERALGYHGAVCDFKRRLIEATLHQVRGNRTHAARALGLQRTYLLRLMRELRVAAPPPPPRGRAPAAR